jgi:hypothetical protein
MTPSKPLDILSRGSGAAGSLAGTEVARCPAANDAGNGKQHDNDEQQHGRCSESSLNHGLRWGANELKHSQGQRNLWTVKGVAIEACSKASCHEHGRGLSQAAGSAKNDSSH